MKFRNYAEKAAWIAWTHDAPDRRAIFERSTAESEAQFAAEYADAMLEAMRAREEEKPE